MLTLAIEKALSEETFDHARSLFETRSGLIEEMEQGGTLLGRQDYDRIHEVEVRIRSLMLDRARQVGAELSQGQRGLLAHRAYRQAGGARRSERSA